MNYKELKQLIQKHNQAYYDNSASMIKDAEYDQLYDKLEASGKFKEVQTEFEAIAGIVSQAQTWGEI